MNYLDESVTRRDACAILGVGLLSVAGLGLTGCSARESGAEGSRETLVPESIPTQTFADSFRTQVRAIWYYIVDPLSGPNKDSDIWRLFVIENGQVTSYDVYYSGVGLTLGGIDKVSDDAIIAFAEENCKKSEPEIAQFHLYTDGTGNKVSYENLQIGGWEEDWDNPISGTYQVYDANYSGYSGYSTYLITRVYSEVNFAFDGLDTEDVEID